MDGVADLIRGSSPTDVRARPVDDHQSDGRHFHWPETERTRAVWVDWEWRAWGVGQRARGVGQRARGAVRRAWQSLTARDHAQDVGGGHGDHLTHATPTPIDEPRVPRP